MKIASFSIILILQSIVLFANEANISPPTNNAIPYWGIGLMGIVIGAIPTHIRAVLKIRSVRAEILEKRIKLIIKIRESEELLIVAYGSARESMKKIMSSWRTKDFDGLIEHREELCKTICDCVIPNLKYTMELTIQRWQDTPDRQLSFIKEEVKQYIDELSSLISDAINHPKLIEKTKKEPLKIRRVTVIRFSDIAKECKKKVRKEAEAIMSGYIEKITSC